MDPNTRGVFIVRIILGALVSCYVKRDLEEVDWLG
jgi:hypothetical protein